jgi:Flp pilus assembly protein TadB
MRNLLARYLSWSGAVERSRPPNAAGWFALGALFLVVGVIVLAIAAVKGSLIVIVGIALLLEGPPLFWRSHRDHRRVEAYKHPPTLRLSSNGRAGLPGGRSTRRPRSSA